MRFKTLLWQGIMLMAIMLCSSSFPAAAKEPDGNVVSANSGLLYPALTDNFYKQVQRRLYWYTAANDAVRQQFLTELDNAAYAGLDKEKYHYTRLKNNAGTTDTAAIAQFDRLFTDAIIAYSKDLLEGANIDKWISSDEVSDKYAANYNTFLLTKVAGIKSAADVTAALSSLEPKDDYYATLKNELKKQLDVNKVKADEVKVSMNFYRWIHHFKFDKYIVVNIPSSNLKYNEKEDEKLQMKVVVGKPSSRTPRMSTFCYEVILYPYWNVPDDIALNELFPKFKKNPAAVDAMNMQIIDYQGKVVDRDQVDWNSYDKSTFPFGFRQGTGCDNSLGVIKFNLTDPFIVYMHDTNYKLAFQQDSRYLSHGCIRLQKPTELGNMLLHDKLDTDLIKACIQGQEPITMKLDKYIPVFVVYMPAVVEDGNVKYYKDVYHLFANK